MCWVYWYSIAGVGSTVKGKFNLKLNLFVMFIRNNSISVLFIIIIIMCHLLK